MREKIKPIIGSLYRIRSESLYSLPFPGAYKDEGGNNHWCSEKKAGLVIGPSLLLCVEELSGWARPGVYFIIGQNKFVILYLGMLIRIN